MVDTRPPDHLLFGKTYGTGTKPKTTIKYESQIKVLRSWTYQISFPFPAGDHTVIGTAGIKTAW